MAEDLKLRPTLRFYENRELEARVVQQLEDLLPLTNYSSLPDLIKSILIVYVPAAAQNPAINVTLAQQHAMPGGTQPTQQSRQVAQAQPSNMPPPPIVIQR